MRTGTLEHRIAAMLFYIISLLAGCNRSDAIPEITVDNVWSRPARVTGVVYMEITNTGGPDHLLRVSSDIAEFVEIHETSMLNDKMTMKHLAGGIVIPGNDIIQFKPSGLHIMLLNLNHELVSGNSFDISLHFQKRGTLTVRASIRSRQE